MSKINFVFAALLYLAPAVVRAQDSTSNQTYFGFQVEREARVRVGSSPSYPTQLRDANINGEVLVQYVIDEQGAPLMPSFRVPKSPRTEFSDAVRRAVARMTFYPAEISGGKKVKQLVQQPF